MTPENLPKKLCGWLNLNMPDVLHPEDDEGPLLTIRCSSKAFSHLLDAFDSAVTNEVSMDRRARYLRAGWIMEALRKQIETQNRCPTIPMHRVIDILQEVKSSLDGTSREATLINELIGEFTLDQKMLDEID